MNEKKELTAVEVLKIIGEICVNYDSDCNQCPLWDVVCRHDGVEGFGHAEKVVEVCAKWHEEQHNPIETEWVCVCRVYAVDDHHERRLCAEFELTDDRNGSSRTQELLAEYVKENQDGGEYIATVEAVCRVKK